LHDEYEAGIASGHIAEATRDVRLKIAEHMAREHRNRNIMLGTGIGFATAGVACTVVGAVGAPGWIDNHQRDVMTGGLLLGVGIGATLMVGSFIRGPFEKMNDDLEAPPPAPSMTATIAPAPGGGLVGLAGTF
jgi:hypothetical protein